MRKAGLRMDRKYAGIGAVILAGGKNRRMHGEKKAFFRYGGTTFLDRVKESLKDLETIYISVDTPEPYEGADLPVIADIYPGTGPLGGICSALETCREDALFVAACDMPFLQSDTVRQLLDAYLACPGTVTIAAEGEWQHALCGIYPKNVLPMLRRQLSEGNYKMRDFLKDQDVQEVQLQTDDRSAVNINSVQEYLKQAGDEPLEIETAVSLLRGSVDPVTDTEDVPLLHALGRVLAGDIAADMDQPPFPRSPLDGYALRASDSEGASRECPVKLKVTGKIYAGQVFEGTVRPGECVRLMTGAPIPEGADTVIRQEDTDYGADEVQIYASLKAFDNYCAAGDDFRSGDVLVPAGTRIGSTAVAAAAGTGCAALTVRRMPKAAVVSTGDETLPAGSSLQAGKIYDTNLPFVTARLAELGVRQVTGMHCNDEVADMADRIRALSADHDLIITTGGVSVGEKDIMHGVCTALGAEKLFWRVKLKPGSPTLAFIFEKTLVICLTGNPYGVMVNFELLVRPVLEKLSGGAVTPGKRVKGTLLEDSPKRGKMRRFLKGIASGSEARFAAGSQASGTIASMAACNCFIELPAGSGGKKGDTVWIHYL